MKSGIAKGLVASALFIFVACNSSADKGGLKVAGGADDIGANAKYPNTVYVEMKGKGFNDKAGDPPRIIRNVGHFVDLQLPGDKVALILSLADAFENSNGVSNLPVFERVSLKIYFSNGTDVAEINDLTFLEDGTLKDKDNRVYTMVSIGIRADKITAQEVAAEKMRAAAQKLFLESKIEVPVADANSKVNIRQSITAYQMMAIPRSLVRNIKGAPLLTAGQRAGLNLTKYDMVGFGENGSKDTPRSLALSEELPSVKKRNYAEVTDLNTDPTKAPTPLRTLWRGVPEAINQIWEVGGSGLCGTNDNSNYDTGAGIYTAQRQLVGFAVRSSAISSGYLGTLKCGLTFMKDMATVVVSPSQTEINFFISQVK